MTMRRFNLMRFEDVHNKSGTGHVAEGVEFEDGSVSIKWCSQYWSGTWFRSIRELKHLHGHEGRTKVSWIDPPGVDDVEAGENAINLTGKS